MRRHVGLFATAAVLWAAMSVASGADDKAAKGKQLYTDQKCQLCHSVEGKGNAKGVLDGVGSKLSADEIKQWLVTPKEMAAKAKAERKPPMKVYNTLPAEDVEALVAYIQTLKAK